MSKAKHPGGRPSSYKPEFCDLIADAMEGGLSAEAAAAKIGISARSLFHWQQEHPQFLQAIQEGRQRALLWWEERALEMASGKPGNAAIVSLGLRNRSRAASGWHDAQRHEVSGPDGGPIQQQAAQMPDLSHLDEDELFQLEQVLKKALGKPEESSARDANIFRAR